ncbi:hypothetical protein D3C80_1271400 [compost metagenome]
MAANSKAVARNRLQTALSGLWRCLPVVVKVVAVVQLPVPLMKLAAVLLQLN